MQVQLSQCKLWKATFLHWYVDGWNQHISGAAWSFRDSDPPSKIISSSGHSFTVVVGVRVMALVNRWKGSFVMPTWWKTKSGAWDGIVIDGAKYFGHFQERRIGGVKEIDWADNINRLVVIDQNTEVNRRHCKHKQDATSNKLKITVSCDEWSYACSPYIYSRHLLHP